MCIISYKIGNIVYSEYSANYRNYDYLMTVGKGGIKRSLILLLIYL